MPLTRIKSLGITDGTIVNADINASAAITGTKISNLNDAKAWVNFNGTGTVAIRGSFNVSSITDNGTADYTINFTTAISDVNYAFAGGGNNTTDTHRTIVVGARTSGMLTTSLQIQVLTQGSASNNNTDAAIVTVVIFR
jgi:hypothetical protein